MQPEKCLDCKILCQVLSDFSTVDITTFKLKNRHFWNTGKKYYRVEYVVKVGLGPVSLLGIYYYKEAN
jgi:hypothetical protein